MSLSPISFIASNYRDYKNYWLKAYETDGTTPKVGGMALDAAGAVTVAKLEINKDGFIETAGGALVIPYIDGAYDLWLFPTEAEADANDTSSAIRLADDITGVRGTGNNIERFTLAGAVANTSALAGDIVQITDRADGQFEYLTSQTADTFRIVACTGVPSLFLVLRDVGSVKVAEWGTSEAALQAAITYGAGGVIDLEDSRTYTTTTNLIISGSGTEIRGNSALIDSTSTGSAISYALTGLGNYPNNNKMSNLAITVRGAGALGLNAQVSFSHFERIGVAMTVSAVGARGIVLIGDNDGSGPYYNTFVNCDIQSNSAGTDNIGIAFQSAPNLRAPNSNTFIGGRVGQCLTCVLVKGNGNGFYNLSTEGAELATTAVAYNFEGDNPENCVENYVIGSYIESVATGFKFNSVAKANQIIGGFATGTVTAYVTDLGVLNIFSCTTNAPWSTSTGLKFSQVSSDVDSLDYYGEGTWTPVPTNVTVNSGTPVWSGTYTRIGNVVTASIKMAGGNIDILAASSNVTLPFNAVATDWGTYGDSVGTLVGGSLATYTGDVYFTSALTVSGLSGTIVYKV